MDTKAMGADFVTLNEVCEVDVQYLFSYLRQAWPEDYTYWVFKPARRADNGEAYPCKDGGKFGIGIVGRLPGSDWAGLTPFAGIYPAQDRSSNEERAWVCVAATGHYLGCATHLESSSGTLAMRQCKYLMSAIASIKQSSSQAIPTIVSGDLNLTHGGFSQPDVQGCVPTDYFRKGDGDKQHVLVSKDFKYEYRQKIDMKYTDHPALLMSLGAS